MRAQPSLRELQEQFAAAVYENDRAVTAHVRAASLGAERRVQIYRRNTFAALTDALAADYPVVRRLVGEAFFDYAADQCIRRDPPRSGNLHDFGAAFAEFLNAFAPAQSLRYLADVARLEWARQEAYHAADASAVALDALAAVPAEKYDRIVFRLHPSARLVASPYPILRMWSANQLDAPEQTVNLDEGPQRALVARPALEVVMMELGAGEFTLLRTIADAKALGSANAAALAAQPRFDLAPTLQKHVVSGVIIGFHVE